MTTTFDSIWHELDATVESGFVPGLVAGVQWGADREVHASGVRAIGSDIRMKTTTPFRIASLSKIVAGAISALMIRDGIFALDDPIQRWLPELANPLVLTSPGATLDDTVPAVSPITVRHLLTLTNGLGVVFEETPLSAAIAKAGVGPGAIPPQLSMDEYLARIGELPLLHQPGERWTYSIGSDILSALITRAAGKPLRDVVAERISAPLGLRNTAFFADAAELPVEYQVSPNGFEVYDPADGTYSKPPLFETLAGGLVSTVPDYLAFLAALADGRLLPTDLLAQMTSDQLTDDQRIDAEPILAANESWGWQVAVTPGHGAPSHSAAEWTVGQSPGSYGWTGGTGTTAFVDAASGAIGVLFTQRMMGGPDDTFEYFTGPMTDLVRGGSARD